MKKHRLIIIGAVGSGKSSLLSCFKGQNMNAKKTQTLIYDAEVIDTPGEYLENPRMYSYIIAAAQGVEYVIFTQDCTKRRCIYPPGFAHSFNGKTIGVITKVDCDAENIKESEKFLATLGLKGPIFITSSKSGLGIQELKSYIDI